MSRPKYGANQKISAGYATNAMETATAGISDLVSSGMTTGQAVHALGTRVTGKVNISKLDFL